MTSDSGLFGGIYERGRAAAELTDAAWLQAMLDVEAALARACAAGALAASRLGAQPSLPTAAEVDVVMRDASA